MDLLTKAIELHTIKEQRDRDRDHEAFLDAVVRILQVGYSEIEHMTTNCVQVDGLIFIDNGRRYPSGGDRDWETQ